MYFYEYFLKAMELDVVMQFSRQPKGLIADDSVTHIFTDEIVELYDSARAAQAPCDDGLARFFEKRALILLSASLETILKNLRKRSAEHPDALNDWYLLYGEANLAGPVQADREMKDRLAIIAEHCGAQVLVLKAEDGNEANSRLARQFLHTLVESSQT